MIKFNDENIYVGQIKQLLSSFNLPQCKVYKNGESYIEGENYIKNNFLYKKTADGEKIVCNYKFGDYIPNITKTLAINSNIYDSHTHEYLGDYLRFIRDFTGVDLMSMYNCFSNNSPRYLDYKDPKTRTRFYSKDSNYNIFMFPVKPNKKYTICLDCDTEISIFCGYYSSNSLVNSNTDFETNSLMVISGCRFNKPFIYDKLLDKEYNNKDKILKMFLKVPSNIKTSIVVLEGDYLLNTEFIIDENSQELANKNIYVLDEDTLEDITKYNYVNRMQLVYINSNDKFLLADRLVEYLSNQAVTPNDPIINNIARLQYTLEHTYVVNKENNKQTYLSKDDIYHYGLWEDNVRQALYTYAEKNDIINKKFDVIGYLDKDVEYKLGGLSELKEDNK